METIFTLHLLSAFLFFVGLLMVILRRNLIVILMGIEMILNAANLSMVLFSRQNGLLDGQIFVLFIIVIAAAESAVGLSILINLYRHFGTIRTEKATTLQG